MREFTQKDKSDRREGILTLAAIMAAALLAILTVFGPLIVVGLVLEVSGWCAALAALYPPAVIALKKVMRFANRRWGADKNADIVANAKFKEDKNEKA